MARIWRKHPPAGEGGFLASAFASTGGSAFAHHSFIHLPSTKEGGAGEPTYSISLT